MNTHGQLLNYRHHRGVHCATAALRNVFYFYTGQFLSEAIIFGLGAGLNFTYGHFSNSPLWLTMGRGSYLENNFCNAVGVTLKTHIFHDDDIALDFVCRSIDHQQLVVADTDMFRLPYMVAALNLPAGVSFGGHKLLITGYDLNSQCAYVHDYAWSTPHTVELSALALARSCPGSPSSSMNRVFLFSFADPLLPIRSAIKLSLARTVCLMRNPHMHYLGLPALDRFCRQLPNWPRLIAPSDLHINLQITAFMMEAAGTGGGNYRLLYSRFLAEAARCLEDERLSRAAGIYRSAAQRWSELAGAMGEAALEALHAPGRLTRLSSPAVRSLMQTLWELENRGLDLIEEIVNEDSQWSLNNSHRTATPAQVIA